MNDHNDGYVYVDCSVHLAIPPTGWRVNKLKIGIFHPSMRVAVLGNNVTPAASAGATDASQYIVFEPGGRYRTSALDPLYENVTHTITAPYVDYTMYNIQLKRDSLCINQNFLNPAVMMTATSWYISLECYQELDPKQTEFKFTYFYNEVRIQ